MEQSTQIQTAVRAELRDVDQALTELEKVERGIAELSTQYKGVVFDVRSTAGMKQAIAARAAVRSPRLEVERIRKVAKAPILELGRNIDGRARAITEQLESLEDPIDAQIKAEEQRKEDERVAKAEAERQRIARIQNNIAEILARPGEAVGLASIEIKRMIECLQVSPEPSADFYEEFVGAAQQAKADSLAKLIELHTAAIAHEAEQEQLRLEREELERLRREDAERRAAQAKSDRLAREEADRAAQAERAEADRLAQVERERLAAEEERARQERLEQERIAREGRETEERAAAEERGRQMAEAARLREEEARNLAAERAEIERRRRELQDQEEARYLAALSLRDAATDALQLLGDRGLGDEPAARRLATVLARDVQDQAA